MKSFINDGSTMRDGTAWKRIRWSNLKALQLRFPGQYTRSGLDVLKDGKKVGWLVPESIPQNEVPHA